MQELRNETKALQADNVKLYEKIRYLQSYRDESNAPSSLSKSLYGIGPSKSKDDSQLGKYRNLYEQSMNPFEAFKGRVSLRCIPLSLLSKDREGDLADHLSSRNALQPYKHSIQSKPYYWAWPISYLATEYEGDSLFCMRLACTYLSSCRYVAFHCN